MSLLDSVCGAIFSSLIFFFSLGVAYGWNMGWKDYRKGLKLFWGDRLLITRKRLKELEDIEHDKLFGPPGTV